MRDRKSKRCEGRVTQKQKVKETYRRRERQKKRSGITALLAARVLVARLPSWVKVSQEQQ